MISYKIFKFPPIWLFFAQKLLTSSKRFSWKFFFNFFWNFVCFPTNSVNFSFVASFFKNLDGGKLTPYQPIYVHEKAQPK